jgi:hypothetical protein
MRVSDGFGTLQNLNYLIARSSNELSSHTTINLLRTQLCGTLTQ